MNGYKTLREVCEMLSLSRRVIQGYEKIGLVKPTARNKYGHLLYDDQAISKIAGIRFCQKLGLSLKEILQLTQLDRSAVCEILEDHLIELEIEQDKLDYLIRKTDEIIDAVGNSDNDLLEVIYRTIKEDRKTCQE